MSRTLASVAALSSLVALSMAPSARADLPPPDGQKFVGYGFKVANVGDYAKDYALLAYPCGTSSGAPVAEMAELRAGETVTVGRRGGNCALYAIARAELDAWNKPGPRSEQALDALFKSAKVRACTGAPNITHQLPKSDPRDSVTEVLKIAKLDDKECVVAAADAPAASPTSTPVPHPSASPGPADSAKASESPPAVTPGCSRCSVGAAQLGPAGVASLALVAMLFLRARSRPR